LLLRQGSAAFVNDGGMTLLSTAEKGSDLRMSAHTRSELVHGLLHATRAGRQAENCAGVGDAVAAEQGKG
jgi:hypothetical protein